MDADRRSCEALVIEVDRIKYAGTAAEAARLFPDAERIDFQNGCILPGFIDAHLHLRDYSLLFKDIDLTRISEEQELLERLAETVGARKDEWIMGGGVSPSILNRLSREDLDAVSPGNPLILYSRDMHAALVNTAVLTQCHIDDHRQDPLGGKIERDESGQPNGILRERAVDLVKRHIPEEKSKTVQNALTRGVDSLLSYGITTFCDCSAFGGDFLMSSLLKLQHRAQLKSRGMIMFGDRDAVRLGSLGIQSSFGNDNIKIGGCKIILDGSLSSLAAHMSVPYRGSAGNGMLLMEEQELYGILKRSYSGYFWTGIHAAGDRAVEIALLAYERLGREVGIPKLLRRIEHVYALRDEDVAKFSSAQVIPVVNPARIPFDRRLALNYLGPAARLMHRLGSLTASNATLAIGSNAPIGSVNPFHSIYAAVERRDFEDGPELRFFPKESISIDNALYACTMGSATALGMESVIGSLEKGKHADLIHVSHDIPAHDSDILKKSTVLMTMVAGETVFERGEETKIY
jgi:predicted amidohydrolase YtcJ